MQEFGGELEVVYPPVSIRAEPPVAVVDANVQRRGTRAVAEAYLRFLYTDEGQEIIARHHYRPSRADALKQNAGRLPALELFPVTAVARGWGAARQRFFADGGEFYRIVKARAPR